MIGVGVSNSAVEVIACLLLVACVFVAALGGNR